MSVHVTDHALAEQFFQFRVHGGSANKLVDGVDGYAALGLVGTLWKFHGFICVS